MRTWLALAALTAGCQPAKPEPAPVDPPAAVVSQWQEAEQRVLSFSPLGFVVSRDNSGAMRSEGDSLIWTGIALASMGCQVGQPLDKSLQDMVLSLNGGLYRHPSLPAQVSLDGALGFYHGVAHRLATCDGKDDWRPLLALHKAYAPYLNRAAGVTLDEPFTVVRDKLLASAGLGPDPGADRQAALETVVAGWAEATRASRAACFRVHLGLQALQTIEALGGTVSANGRNAFCSATDGLGLPTTDHWCGRGDLRGWVAGFKLNVWEYQHQRCTGWEQPDGNGFERPGVDLLRGLADAYRFMF